MFIHMDDGPYDHLKFGIGVLLLEADQAITTLVNSIMRPIYRYIVLFVCFCYSVCVYSSFSMPS